MATILLVLFFSLFNFWIYWVFEYNFFLGELLTVESVLLYLSSQQKNTLTISVLTILILTLISSFLLVNHFDKNIFSSSEVESIRTRERQEYFAKELGKVYKNRIGIFYFNHLRLSFGKVSDNFFSVLDLGPYFFTAPLADQTKFPLVLSPIFIAGLVILIKNLKRIQIIYLISALLISSVTKADFKIGPLLMFPFIALCLATGFIRLFTKGLKFFK